VRNTSFKPIDLASAIQRVADQPAAELTLAELVRAFSIARCDGSHTRLRKWLDAFGDLSAWEVTPERLQIAAQAMLEHGYKPSAINRDLSALGSAYIWAKNTRKAPRGFRSPTVDVPRFKEQIRRVMVEAEKVDALCAYARASRDRRFGVFVALLHDTGARKSELLRRRWCEVDLERLEIIAPITKNETPRVLFMQPATADLIRRVFPKRPSDDLVFEGRVPGQPISFRKAWEAATAQVGLTDFHMHDMRHVKAASMLRADVTLPQAAQVLGHSPQVLARRYGHLETAALRRASQSTWQASAITPNS
jgi:integrase